MRYSGLTIGDRRAALLAGCLLAATSALAQSCPDAQVSADALARAQAQSLASAASARHSWEQLLKDVRACGDAELEAQTLAAWTNASMQHGDSAAALESETARYTLAVRAQLRATRADAAARLGTLYTDRGEIDLAERRLQEAAALFEELEAYSESADVRSRMSRLHRRSGDYLAALQDEQSALRLRRQINPPPNVWRSLLNVAVLYEQLELLDEARRRYGEALDEAEREGVVENVAIVLSDFAGFLSDFGAPEAPQAKAMAERALAIERGLTRPVQLAGALLQVGRADLNLGQFDAADSALREALALADSINQASLRAHILFRWGELALARGELPLALERVNQARVAYEAQGNRHRLVKVQAMLERIYQQQGDALAAASAGRERYRLRDELLGARATSRLGELMSQFELSEERLRNEHLQQEKTLAELRLVSEQRKLQTLYAIAAAIAAVLALFSWRHYTVERLYRLLRERNAVVQAQAEELANANRRLTEQSDRLYQASITDVLTGVANRAHGMQQLEAVCADAASSAVQPLLMLIDVDHFKAVNDNNGHPAGDQVLVEVALSLRTGLPAGVELSRVGGEEFMVLMRDADASAGMALAEQLRQRVAALTVQVASRQLRVSISIGVAAAANQPDRTPRGLYAAADHALYQAKSSGRNRVHLAG